MIGNIYKSVAIQIPAFWMDRVAEIINVTALGDDCLYVNMENLTEPEYLAELLNSKAAGRGAVVEALNFCHLNKVDEIQFYC